MTIATRLLSANDLLDMPNDGFCYELIRGELRHMSPAGHHHGQLAMRVGAALERYVYEHGLGEVYAAETSFILERDPGTVRAPGAPNVTVEVVAPNDRYSEVRETVAAWLDAGTQLVVVVEARRREVVVHEPGGTARTLRASDTLDGGVVPGCRCRYALFLNKLVRLRKGAMHRALPRDLVQALLLLGIQVAV
jgi:Uma2 family endonuclease